MCTGGELSTIESLRCDGFVEVCYEYNGLDCWGRMDPGGAQFSILEEDYQPDHNEFQLGNDPEDGDSDFWGWLMPITQIGYADTFIDSKYPEYTSGDFDYTEHDYEGTHWDSALSTQLLVQPALE